MEPIDPPTPEIPAPVARALRLLSSAGAKGPRAAEQPHAVAAHVALSAMWPLYPRELDEPPQRDAGEVIDETRALLSDYLAGEHLRPAVALSVAEALAALSAPVFPSLDD